MSKFTPGPWKTRDGSVVHAGGSSNLLIVAASNIHANPYNDDYTSECEANANLIAAAPEMYEALKAINDAYYVGGTDAAFIKAMSYLADDMRAAIAKAKGRQ